MTRVLTEIDPSLPLIQLSASFIGGSIADPEGQEGLTRLLVRLMRRTGGGRTAEQLDLLIDQLGSTLGVDVGTSACGFSGSVITRNWAAFRSLLADVVLRPNYDDEELARLKRETLSELKEIQDNDRALVRRWFTRALFRDHRYGRTSVGNSQSLANITAADLEAHYPRLFSPSNLALALAGDVNDAQLAEFEATFTEGLPPNSQPEALVSLEAVTEPSPRSGRNLVIVDKPERSQTQILIGGLGSSPHDPDHVPLLVANTVFGGTFTARLSEEVRSKRGWSYGAYSSLPYDRRRQAFSMWTFPAATDAAACVALELQLLESWVNQGITEVELANAKSYLVRSNVFHTDTAAKRMGLLLDEHLHALPENYHKAFAERVAAVTLEQANEAVKKRISLDDIVIAVVGTASELADAVSKAIPRLQSVEIIDYAQD